MVFKLSESRLLRFLGNLYTTLMRCTPSIVLLFLVYYGVPAIAESLNIYLHDVHSGVFVVLTFTIQFADRKSTRLNSSHVAISYAVFCLKKKKKNSMKNSYSELI